jgi:hypothetical protein
MGVSPATNTIFWPWNLAWGKDSGPVWENGLVLAVRPLSEGGEVGPELQPAALVLPHLPDAVQPLQGKETESIWIRTQQEDMTKLEIVHIWDL